MVSARDSDGVDSEDSQIVLVHQRGQAQAFASVVAFPGMHGIHSVPASEHRLGGGSDVGLVPGRNLRRHIIGEAIVHRDQYYSYAHGKLSTKGLLEAIAALHCRMACQN